jgi:hypothetical protein
MAARRRNWHTEASLLLATAVVVMAIFALTPLDIPAARFFYHPQGTDHWPLGNLWLSSALYRLAPFITALLLAVGLTALFVGYVRVKARWRESGIFISRGEIQRTIDVRWFVEP